MVTTAQKKGVVEAVHLAAAQQNMTRLNKVGSTLGQVKGVHAMTDVTGFGLGGHALEMARATGVDLVFDGQSLPLLDRKGLMQYHADGCIPGGTRRNFASYGQDIEWESAGTFVRDVVCDPQTSGGLLVAVDPSAKEEVEQILRDAMCHSHPIGAAVEGQGKVKLGS